MVNAEALHLLSRLNNAGVQISVNGSKLLFDAPPGVLTEQDKDALRQHKTELLQLLSNVQDLPPALQEYPDRNFDERRRVWTRGPWIEPTRATLPALRHWRQK